MSKSSNFLSTFSVTNFKAIRKSGTIRFNPFTAVIGNNGSGKSSLIESLATYRKFILGDIDRAFGPWHGFGHIRNKHVAMSTLKTYKTSGIRFSLAGLTSGYTFSKRYSVSTEINERKNGNEVYIAEESGKIGKAFFSSNGKGGTMIRASKTDIDDLSKKTLVTAPHESIFSAIPEFRNYIGNWQFLSLNPGTMGEPKQKSMRGTPSVLQPDGSNIGEYLLDILNGENGVDVFNGIVEQLKYVLPYTKDIQPTLTSELDKSVFLQLSEGNFKVPGWLLSTGTLRVLALLSVLRNPSPPTLVIIEELENGLDPRTIHLLIEEIMNATESGRTQVIATTHSPYLLDLLPLSTILFVERPDGGEPVFSRPIDEKSKRKWAEQFGPGQLYTMNRLSKGAAR
jgi:predicted ATPase